MSLSLSIKESTWIRAEVSYVRFGATRMNHSLSREFAALFFIFFHFVCRFRSSTSRESERETWRFEEIFNEISAREENM